MRVVLDTNVVVAGLLWSGKPHRLINAAIDNECLIFSSPALLAELLHTLQYVKFAQRIAAFELTPAALHTRYSTLVSVVTPSHVPRVITQDADDDQVLACALAGKVDLIVSGDKHLHSLGGSYQGIAIVRPAEALERLGFD